MSTQSTPSILFTHQPAQQSFRLLELPPDLADLLSSDNPPRLELKSPSTTSTPSQPTDAATATEFVNLCTPSQTFSIRQVQSSNSLHILQPSNGGRVRRHDLSIVGDAREEGEDLDTDMVDADLALNVEGTVTSIAKCGSTLELHTPPEGFSAVPFLRGLLGVYDNGMRRGEDGDEDMEEESTETRKNIRDRLFHDIPVSMAQCERGWAEICAFVLPPRASTEKEFGLASSCCWRPSAGMELQVWKRAVEGAVLQGIDLGKQFLVKDLWKSVLDDDGLEPFPRPLFEAVIRRIRESGEGAGGGFAVEEIKWASIDKETCVRWVGEAYLEATASSAASAISQNEFLNAWRDQLPETWREDASLALLPENCYMHPEPKTICFATEGDRQKVKKNLSTDTSAATAAKKTRNWHELFNQKRQKR
ncbi:hypothetical protein BDW59DRAFT_38640 [Aspergillus cavernicola]|uniref:Sister chromatid cohesion protein Dcc1 n=1 Tax=Aspergillus cavernicola TaxID=176166 RepID=A0ABR4INT0_9EURO